MLSLIILFLMCLVFSAFFSGSEMAFVSVNETQLQKKADNGDTSAQNVIKLKGQTQNFLTSVLIANNIVNVAATAILTYLFEIHFKISSEWLVTIIMVPLLVVFGEMLPKDYCRINGEQVVLRTENFLTLFSQMLSAPSKYLLTFVNRILNLVGVGDDKSIFVSEKEFRSLIEEGTQKGVLEKHEKHLIDMILDFERIRIHSVMVPLQEVPKVNLSKSIKKVKEIAKRQRTPMVLVYEEIPSIIVGMIYVFDLLFEEDEDKGLKDYLRAPVFLSGDTTLEKAFLTLQQRRQSYAVVTDANRDVQGVVPIEKLLASK